MNALAAIAALPLSAAIIWATLRLRPRRLVAAPSGDRWHDRETPVGGGIGIVLGLVGAVAPGARDRRAAVELRARRRARGLRDPVRRRPRRRRPLAAAAREARRPARRRRDRARERPLRRDRRQRRPRARDRAALARRDDERVQPARQHGRPRRDARRDRRRATSRSTPPRCTRTTSCSCSRCRSPSPASASSPSTCAPAGRPRSSWATRAARCSASSSPASACSRAGTSPGRRSRRCSCRSSCSRCRSSTRRSSRSCGCSRGGRSARAAATTPRTGSSTAGSRSAVRSSCSRSCPRRSARRASRTPSSTTPGSRPSASSSASRCSSSSRASSARSSGARTAPRGVGRTLVVHRQRFVEVLVDFALITASLATAFLLRVDGTGTDYQRHIVAVSLPVILAARYAFFIPLGLYRGVWRYASATDAVRVIVAVVASEVVAVGFIALTNPFGDFPLDVYVIDAILCTVLIGASRFGERALRARVPRRRRPLRAAAHAPRRRRPRRPQPPPRAARAARRPGRRLRRRRPEAARPEHPRRARARRHRVRAGAPRVLPRERRARDDPRRAARAAHRRRGGVRARPGSSAASSGARPTSRPRPSSGSRPGEHRRRHRARAGRARDDPAGPALGRAPAAHRLRLLRVRLRVAGLARRDAVPLLGRAQVHADRPLARRGPRPDAPRGAGVARQPDGARDRAGLARRATRAPRTGSRRRSASSR